MTFRLFNYQQDLIDTARSLIRNSNVMIVSPPGSGKSVVISEIAKLTTQKGGRVLFIVHRKELIEQIHNSFKRHRVKLNNVDLLTVVKAKNRLKLLQKPTLIITDEGHHGRADTYQAIYDFFNDVPRLGFTATPWRMSGDGFTNIYNEMVEGKSVKWLIENNRLAPYRYFSLPSIDISKLKVQNGDYSSKSIDEAIGTAIFGNVVDEYIKHADGQKAILYAHSIDASMRYAEEFNISGIKAIHVDSKTPKREREQTMQSFRDGEIQVLCNVDLISEGFDVPDCSVTILCRPTKSLVLFLQQSMRSMRYQPNKEAIIIDNVLNWKIHGLPDDEHDWESYFKGGWKKRQKKNTVQAKECPECSALWPLNQQNCEICGHDFGEKERKEKLRIQAELEEIKRANVLAQKKFGDNIQTNWEIAKARAKIKGGKPLFKIVYFYMMSDKYTIDVKEMAAITNTTEQQIYQAINWINKKQIRK